MSVYSHDRKRILLDAFENAGDFQAVFFLADRWGIEIPSDLKEALINTVKKLENASGTERSKCLDELYGNEATPKALFLLILEHLKSQ